MNWKLGLALLGGGLALGSSFTQKPEVAVSRSILICSWPTKANLWRGKVLLGTTPYRLTAPEGVLNLELRLPGHQTSRLELSPDDEVICARMKPVWASIKLKREEGATYRLGPGLSKELKGKGPFKLPPGKYQLFASKDGLPAKPKSFNLKSGQDLSLSVDWPSLVPPQIPKTRPANAPRVASPQSNWSPPEQPRWREPEVVERPYTPPPRLHPPPHPQPPLTPPPPAPATPPPDHPP